MKYTYLFLLIFLCGCDKYKVENNDFNSYLSSAKIHCQGTQIQIFRLINTQYKKFNTIDKIIANIDKEEFPDILDRSNKAVEHIFEAQKIMEFLYKQRRLSPLVKDYFFEIKKIIEHNGSFIEGLNRGVFSVNNFGIYVGNIKELEELFSKIKLEMK